jgi:hypothetical protein
MATADRATASDRALITSSAGSISRGGVRSTSIDQLNGEL